MDDTLALDAGSITSALTLEEQSLVRSVLVTHQHYDHIKDLATLGFNRLGRGQVRIYCTHEVRSAVEATILNKDIWLDFFSLPTPEMPTFLHTPVMSNVTLNIGGYSVRPVPVVHSVAAVGYEVRSPGGGTLLYTGDSGPGSGPAWASSQPDLLVTEVSYTNSETALAARYGHLSPKLLAEELKTFRNSRGRLPRVAIVHVDPYREAEIAAEVATIAHCLSADIWLPEEGSVIAVG